ncbi:MAG: N-acetyltransferase [Oscillospiraceae bacterium]|nr:N-acetyltransferase [Oscillospiraceae bacterium]
MDLIKLTPENLETEHICCAIASEKDCQVKSKKAWLKKRLDDGLVFLKGNVRGKCFIEYIPAEAAWLPVNAPGYMFIDCLWVSGQYKGHGYSDLLLNECIRDAKEKGKLGLAVLTSVKKKMGFLADPKYLAYKGFVKADTCEPYFELMYLPFNDNETAVPEFNTKDMSSTASQSGFTVYYTNQCPFTAKYVPLLEAQAIQKGAPIQIIHIDSLTKAQTAPCPFTAFSLYYNGQFITHEIQSEKKFEKILAEKGYI